MTASRPTSPRRRLLRIVLAVLPALCLLLLPAVAGACPGCRDSLEENSTEQTQLVQGYAWSILFMMSMPYAILGTFGTCMYLSVRRARRQQAEQAARERQLPATDPTER